MKRLPDFLVKRIPKQENIRSIRRLLGDNQVNTVCEEAFCPNIGECFSRKTCTFLILGGTCTRNCAFCGINKGRLLPPDPAEPERIAEAVKKLDLNYVVITSVTRDDLADGGAGHFAAVLRRLKLADKNLSLEVLIPDFQGNENALKIVLDENPRVLNHNVETAPRFYPGVRPQADYKRSLKVLNTAKKIKKDIYTKSGFMVGLGESNEETAAVLSDLREVGCDIVTIGQYLPPSKAHPKAVRFVLPEEFEDYKKKGEKLGLKVIAGPFVRSSYQAEETLGALPTGLPAGGGPAGLVP
ncbi:lipoyl synthase [Candidatus Saganbacteria bacterium]|uniref:Lipoyl synthase n=1 Tax=Candidatus Saganbacteria bacterium TaxID=2575572 RepID=A0A9D6ULH6_UNCSA|nr:lipoyl synthase [Candidatus Saganbacteria bacterium]